MIDVDLHSGSAASSLTRSSAACLASVTETPVHGLPQTDGDLTHTLGIWRDWLAEHDAGLVPMADPDRFRWAGWWIAIIRDEQPREPAEFAVLAFGTPPGIVLSPHDPTLLGRATGPPPGRTALPRGSHPRGLSASRE